MPRSLLVVELGNESVRELRRGFVVEGFQVDCATGRGHARELAAMRDYSGVLLAGARAAQLVGAIQILRTVLIKALPILCVSTLSVAEERDLLAAGAAHCAPADTPFSLILAQMRALFELAEGFPSHYRVLDLGIDPVARRASRAGKPLVLRRKEFDLLVCLAERRGAAVAAQDLHEQVWPERDFCPRRIAVHIHNLRRAITPRRHVPLLHTVRGVGYVLSARKDSNALRDRQHG